MRDYVLTVGMALSLLLILAMTYFAFATWPHQCPGASEPTWTSRGWLCVLEVE